MSSPIAGRSGYRYPALCYGEIENCGHPERGTEEDAYIDIERRSKPG